MGCLTCEEEGFKNNNVYMYLFMCCGVYVGCEGGGFGSGGHRR